MNKLQLVDVVKRFGNADAPVVRGLSTGVADGKMLVLLGPSGCGKTTTLRMVAGLLHPDGGDILMDGKPIAGSGWGLPPERRNLGMVFQSYAVWPHKTTFENVAYGLQLRNLPRQEIRRRAERALQLVHLSELAERYPSELSGGQQQRIALARAIVVEPAVLLLDEPLSNLDATLREQMRIELKTLQRELGLTSIYVTHDQAEAMMLADHLVVMRNGLIEQEGRAEDVYRRPQTAFLAGFLGVTNLLKGRTARMEPGAGQIEVAGLGTVSAFLDEAVRGRLALGGAAGVSVRPMGLTVSHARDADAVNSFEGTVEQRIFLGDLTEYFIRTGDFRWRVHVESSRSFQPGEVVWLDLSPEAGTIVTDAGEST